MKHKLLESGHFCSIIKSTLSLLSHLTILIVYSVYINMSPNQNSCRLSPMFLIECKQPWVLAANCVSLAHCMFDFCETENRHLHWLVETPLASHGVQTPGYSFLEHWISLKESIGRDLLFGTRLGHLAFFSDGALVWIFPLLGVQGSETLREHFALHWFACLILENPSCEYLCMGDQSSVPLV